MSYTHQKRPYHAECIQWNGNNSSDIQLLFAESEVVQYDRSLLVRFAPGNIQCLNVGDWAVKGENGLVKVYPDAVFHVKYEALA